MVVSAVAVVGDPEVICFKSLGKGTPIVFPSAWALIAVCV